MNLIDVIPIGKKYKMTRQELMDKAKITDIRIFRQQINSLRNNYIVIYEDGYYLPSSKEEYLEFIQKQCENLIETSKTIQLAYKEMEGLGNV